VAEPLSVRDRTRDPKRSPPDELDRPVSAYIAPPIKFTGACPETAY